MDTVRLVQKFLPKHADIDKVLKIQKNILKGTQLPFPVKEIYAGYLISPCLRDMYLYLAQNKLPHSKVCHRKSGKLGRKICLIIFIVFKILTKPEKETGLLPNPETCADSIISLYHSSLCAGHQGIIKTYLTVGNKFFIPGLIHHLKPYIKGIIYVNYQEMKSPCKTITTED